MAPVCPDMGSRHVRRWARKDARVPSGSERFSVADLHGLSELVATAWLSAADRDWSVRARTPGVVLYENR